jgi:hypothetical protein
MLFGMKLGIEGDARRGFNTRAEGGERRRVGDQIGIQGVTSGTGDGVARRRWGKCM